MGTMGWIVLGVIVLIGLWLVMTYNGLVSLRQRCRQAFSDIDVQLKQRHDLVPNSGGDGEGLRVARARHLGSRGAGAQRRRGSARACGPGAGGRHAARRASPALRVGRGLSRSQGQHQFPAAADRALRSGEQDRRRAPLLQQHGRRIQLHARKLPGRPVRPVAWASVRRSSSTWRRASAPPFAPRRR